MFRSMQFDNQDLSAFGKNWLWFFIWGIVLIALGALAISASTLTTMISVVFLGVLILLSGVVILLDTFSFWRRNKGSFFLHLCMSLLYLFVGVTLIKDPVAGSYSLTFLLGLLYTIVGIFRLVFSSSVRLPRWGWHFFNGIVTLLLGILILSNWPESSLFIIGLFVGIDLLFCGFAYVMAALTAKSMS